MSDKVVRIEHTIRAASDNQARNIFRLAADRLMLVRGWSRLADSLLFCSEHRDEHGAPVSRPAKADDFINLTSDEQRPFGWMQVIYVSEAMADGDSEAVLVTRPVGLPFEAENDSGPQTSPAILRVVRHGLEITSAISIDSNPITTVFERLGVYMVQWRSLVTGLLSDLDHPDDPNARNIIGTESHYA
ncbi:MAG: hypothetical protein QM762_02450 [Chryseolinea sp.]